jgi:hypothetical protein
MIEKAPHRSCSPAHISPTGWKMQNSSNGLPGVQAPEENDLRSRWMMREPRSHEILIGLDIGTSTIKAVLTTPEGQILAQVSVEYPVHYPKPGWAEQDPQDWWLGVVEAVRALEAPSHGKVAGLG